MSKRRNRIYWRAGRAWADFRDYAAEGGKREPLVASGERRATESGDEALALAEARLTSLKAARDHRKRYGPGRGAQLAEYASAHLVAKRKAGKVTTRWMASSQTFLDRAVAFFGGSTDLDRIDVEDVRRWAEHLATMPARPEKPAKPGETRPPAPRMTGGTIRHHLNTLQNLYKYAASEKRVPTGYNPVRDLLDKPKARKVEARWLEVYDAALLLEAARTYKPARPDLAFPALYALVATWLLTGGRRAEVLGLEVSDINFDRNLVTIRPNRWRRLKTETSHRSVPLWPQLREILTAYLSERTAQEVLSDRPTHTLLFPAAGMEPEAMVTDFRKVLDAAAGRAGWKAGEIRSKMFRHSYCAARLQTLDRGAPVSVFTVGRELGHGGDALVKRIYGHLGDVRHRSEVVEYRIEQHEERLRDRLVLLPN